MYVCMYRQINKWQWTSLGIKISSRQWKGFLTCTHEAFIGLSQFMFLLRIPRPTLYGSVGSKFLGTNLVSFEANWILEFVLALDPSLHLGSPNHDLSFELLLLRGSKPIDFPFKMVPCRFSLNLSPAILEKCYSPLGQLPFNANYYLESLPSIYLLKELEEKEPC
jgi:hypothetical protein